MLSKTGDIKRIPKASFRTQRRNGKGVKTEEDATMALIRTNTVDALLLFTNKGKMYRMLVDKVPVGTNTSKGTNVSGLINLEPNEKVIAITNLAKNNEDKYVVFITKQGLIKKTSIEEYIKTKRSTGIAAITLKEGDSIANIELMNEEDLVLITKFGQAIHFETKDISAIGRVTSGVKSIKLAENDEVIIGLPIKNTSCTIATFSEKGYAKKVNIDEIPTQGRAGKGLCIYKQNTVYGNIVGATIVTDEDSVLLIGKKAICISATEIPLLSRTALGNQMIKDAIINSVVKL
jgi:DNA gyrase subunit A